MDVMTTQNWDAIYQQHAAYFTQPPHEDMPAVASTFRERGVKNVLDVGCGTGRHVLYLARLGFTVCGMDSSAEAIRAARKTTKAAGLSARLTVGSMFERLPYPDASFHAVVCTKALNHGLIESIRGATAEMERVLRPGGLVFIVVTKSRKALPSKKQERYCIIIADRTLIPKTGREIGVIHFQFNKAILLREFEHFRVLRFRVDSAYNYSMVAEKKG